MLRNGAELSEETVKEYVKDEPGPVQGAARGGVPEELPRNATGKVLKRELKGSG